MRLLTILALLALLAAPATATELPKVVMQNGASQLIVHGKPYLMFGGELGNSSAGTETQAEAILPRLAKLRSHLTVTAA